MSATTIELKVPGMQNLSSPFLPVFVTNNQENKKAGTFQSRPVSEQELLDSIEDAFFRHSLGRSAYLL
ncbi:MAG: hypothetical protein ACSLE2_10485 [Lysobacterales bacterium]